MIERVLKLLLEERILDKNEIARRIGIQNETLDDIIRLLIQQGLLRTESNGCEDSSRCSGCHGSPDCDIVTSTGQAFFVTEKGKAYASRVGGRKV
ncbi:MAG: FeoC-like transcriptional regulator [Candidatus Thorarchaeota archaeon]